MILTLSGVTCFWEILPWLSMFPDFAPCSEHIKILLFTLKFFHGFQRKTFFGDQKFSP